VTGESGEQDTLRRLLDDVQRLGLATASAVIDRFSSMVRPLAPSGATRAGGVGGAPGPPLWPVARHWGFVAPGVGPAAQPGIETVVLSPVAAGGLAGGTAWLHNTTGAAAGRLALRCTDLVGPGAALLPGGEVALAPAEVPEIGPGESVAVSIEVAVPTGQPPGTYRGLVVMSDPPGGAVALHLLVFEDAGDR
jgi:hypothetical protein